MGLDMYLTGAKFFHGEGCPRARGARLGERYHLGYWRKHPNLHGFIVQTFADGQDQCQEIDLSVENLETILQAIQARQLPETTGFFFGTSDASDEQLQEDLEIFNAALAWLKTEEPGVWRSVAYQASW